MILESLFIYKKSQGLELNIAKLKPAYTKMKSNMLWYSGFGSISTLVL